MRAKLKVINKANRWRIRQDREAWEMRRLHTSKKRGNDFYKWMNDATRKTSKIGPVLTPDRNLKATDSEMAPLKRADIENSYPLGTQARGQSILPIVIT